MDLFDVGLELWFLLDGILGLLVGRWLAFEDAEGQLDETMMMELKNDIMFDFVFLMTHMMILQLPIEERSLLLVSEWWVFMLFLHYVLYFQFPLLVFLQSIHDCLLLWVEDGIYFPIGLFSHNIVKTNDFASDFGELDLNLFVVCCERYHQL